MRYAKMTQGRDNDSKSSNIYIQQDATLHSLFYLETTLHVSGGTATHHQERKQLYLQHLVFVTPLLLPLIYAQRGATLLSFFKRLSMFRVVRQPIIRSANNCIYSI